MKEPSDVGATPEGWITNDMELNIIQIAPLAFMRGRTLNDAVVILDEAQNTTTQQIKIDVYKRQLWKSKSGIRIQFQYVLLLDGDCEHLVFSLYGIHRWDVFRKLGQKYDICLKVKSFVLVYSCLLYTSFLEPDSP